MRTKQTVKIRLRYPITGADPMKAHADTMQKLGWGRCAFQRLLPYQVSGGAASGCAGHGAGDGTDDHRGAPGWSGHSQNLFTVNMVKLGLTAVVLFYAGSSFFTRALGAARHGRADMNTLVAVGTGSAFLFSTWAALFGSDEGPWFPRRMCTSIRPLSL